MPRHVVLALEIGRILYAVGLQQFVGLLSWRPQTELHKVSSDDGSGGRFIRRPTNPRANGIPVNSDSLLVIRHTLAY